MFREGDLHLRPLVPLSECEDPEALGLRAEAGAQVWVVPAWVEEEFYRLNNLRFQIERLFSGVWGVRVDEEALARAAEEARARVRGSYLLAERAEAFVAALPPAGTFVLRRPEGGGEEAAEGALEALWALKRLWAARWSLDAVIRRGPGGWPEPAAAVVSVVGEP